MKLSGLRLITALAGLPAIAALPIIGCGTKKAAVTTVTVTDKTIDKITIEDADAFAVADAAGWKDEAILAAIQAKVDMKVTTANANAKAVVAALVGALPAAPGATKSADVKFSVKAKDAADGTFSKEFTIKVTQTAG
ncbi:hypothetical protein [Spiroplasma endosymbiont of 'Nebria riversi']|uniref:hypothetical protein n=1 Tax=Spiroplasma endosymbiont of 'Nebria riversi' TaxID=2792084 RepID=UPI001C04F127|nr:hypothetical protein [Spiroplasma endosymbiont of 'Nebria riversi']